MSIIFIHNHNNRIVKIYISVDAVTKITIAVNLIALTNPFIIVLFSEDIIVKQT